jgi:hypothetical protein
MAFCLLCKADVNYSTTMSTGMLTRHVRTKHRSDYQSMLELEMAKKFRGDELGNVKVQSCIDKYVEFNASFVMKLTRWIVQTYQPLNACENQSFRDMCRSSNMKAPYIGVYKVKSLLSKETACFRMKLRKIL